jgi:hypothetical protein
MRSIRKVVSLVLALGLVVALTACTSGSHGSRHYIYASLDELVGDAKVVVVGTVEGTSPVKVDEAAFTAVDVAVQEELFPEGLGEKPIDQSTPSYANDRLSTDRIVVRQVGTPGAGPASDLKVGQQYLLFLTPTGLPEDPDTTFYVTGGVAGMFVLNGDSFVRVSDEDELPEQLSLAELR